MFDPTTIPGLVFWPKADLLYSSDGEAVLAWPDSSPAGGHDAYEGDSGWPATFLAQAVGGLPAVHFDPGAFLETAPFSFGAGKTAWSIFAVARSTGGSYPQAVVCKGDPNKRIGGIYYPESNFLVGYKDSATFEGVGYTGSSPPNDKIVDTQPCVTGEWHVLSAVHSPAFVQTWVDGASNGRSGGAATSTTLTRSVQLGAQYGALFLQGDICEVLIYNSGLSATDRASVESYLKDKYGL